MWTPAPPKSTMIQNRHSSFLNDFDSTTESDSNKSSGLEWWAPENQLGLDRSDIQWGSEVNKHAALKKKGKPKNHKGAIKYWDFTQKKWTVGYKLVLETIPKRRQFWTSMWNCPWKTEKRSVISLHRQDISLIENVRKKRIPTLILLFQSHLVLRGLPLISSLTQWRLESESVKVARSQWMRERESGREAVRKR